MRCPQWRTRWPSNRLCNNSVSAAARMFSPELDLLRDGFLCVEYTATQRRLRDGSDVRLRNRPIATNNATRTAGAAAGAGHTNSERAVMGHAMPGLDPNCPRLCHVRAAVHCI